VKKAWEKFGKPVNVGWRVTAQELLSLHFPEGNYASIRGGCNQQCHLGNRTRLWVVGATPVVFR
jgi:hypothetical protein